VALEAIPPFLKIGILPIVFDLSVCVINEDAAEQALFRNLIPPGASIL
jgi:hypothetical protein